MFVVFDLDGTLALTEHRAHFLNQPNKDWQGFYAACDMDKPNYPIITTLFSCEYAGDHIEIWSGRSAEVEDKTLVWLIKHDLGHIPIRMRPKGDHWPDTVLKAEWLDQNERKPDLVFEDRASMVAMWRSRGIVCCQVAPGDF